VRYWIAMGLVFLVAAAAGATSRWWLPPLWGIAKANRQDLGLATDVATWVWWVGAAMAALIAWVRRPRAAPVSELPPTQITSVGGDQIHAAGDAQTGGVRIEGPVGGDVAGRDIHKTINWQAPAPSVPTPRQLPEPPGDFTGRAEELEELKAAISQGGVSISGLGGMGGVGKTALALKLADEMKECYPDGQFYLDLKGTGEPLSPAQAMGHIVHGYDPEARLPENQAELEGRYRSVLHGKRALLLMDNAADGNRVEPLIPPEGCLLLVTSRQHFTLPGLYAKNLDVLPPEDSRALLLTIAPRIGEHADEIAGLCGRLPLALRAAASLLVVRPDLDPSSYATRLRDETKRLEHIGSEGVPLSVEASLSLSYNLLDAEMQQRWRRLAVFPESFNAEGTAAVWELEVDAAQNVLSVLVACSMVEWDEATRRYRLHDLLRLVADSHVGESERIQAAKRQASHYARLLTAADDLYLKGGDGVVQGLALFDLERANIEAGQRWSVAGAAENDEAAKLCSHYGGQGNHVRNLRQRPRERIGWIEAAVGGARRINDRAAEGVHVGNLGLAYFYLGEIRRAIEYYDQHVAIAREIHDRQGEANALGNLGIAYAELGSPGRAIRHYKRQLAITRKIRDRRGEGAALGNLGLAYGDLGKHGHAIRYHKKHLAIDREIGDKWGEGNALGNLGTAYLQLGRPGRAIEYLQQALAIHVEIGDSRGQGEGLWKLALALKQLGKREEAIANAEAALAIFEQIEDPTAPEVRGKLAEWRAEKK